jgi:hypothetical protein
MEVFAGSVDFDNLIGRALMYLYYYFMKLFSHFEYFVLKVILLYFLSYFKTLTINKQHFYFYFVHFSLQVIDYLLLD